MQGGRRSLWLFGEPPVIPLPVPPDEPPGLATALLALAAELGEARRERQEWAERAEALGRKAARDFGLSPRGSCTNSNSCCADQSRSRLTASR